MFCESGSQAKRRYQRGAMGIALAYMGSVLASRTSVNHWHPQGWHLWLAAALPTIPMICFAWIVARYLREERDDYQRDLMVRAMLWGTAAVLSLSVFSDFLHAYGWTGEMPNFLLFMVFWLVACIAKYAYTASNRVVGDE